MLKYTFGKDNFIVENSCPQYSLHPTSIKVDFERECKETYKFFDAIYIVKHQQPLFRMFRNLISKVLFSATLLYSPY